MIVFNEKLQNGWQSWGWASLNYYNTAYVRSGSYSISVYATQNQALSIHHDPFLPAPYQAVRYGPD